MIISFHVIQGQHAKDHVQTNTQSHITSIQLIAVQDRYSPTLP